MSTSKAFIKAGDILDGRYRFIRQIGVGGFGTTYLAEQLKPDGLVVIKVSHEAGPGALERLQREFGLLTKLKDPAFASVLHVGKFGEERAYIVTRWIAGQSLGHLLTARGRLSLDDALAVVRTLAKGLARLHEVGFVHRDIKPENIIIPGGAENPSFTRATLLDFGVIGELLHDTHLTREGLVVGTPTYMSPEQIQGHSHSPATDVYGLGLLLYEMVFGRLPFEGPVALDLMLRQVREDPIVPDEPAMPAQVRALLIDALKRNAAARPRDAAAFLERLEGIEKTSFSTFPDFSTVATTGAYPRLPQTTPPRYRSAPTMAMRRSRSPVIAFLALILVVGALLGIWDTYGFPVEISIPSLGWAGLWKRLFGTTAFLLIVAGLVLVLAGIMGGRALRRLRQAKQTQVNADVERLLTGATTKKTLTETLQIEVREIIARCRAMDERILGVTIIRMMSEHDQATASDDRLSALMNVVTLLEKLRGRLSPWYARFAGQLAVGATFVGIISGLVTIVAGLVQIARDTNAAASLRP